MMAPDSAPQSSTASGHVLWKHVIGLTIKAAFPSVFHLISQFLPMPVPFPNSRNNVDTNAFILYSRSVHDYTLRLWAESRKLAEENARAVTKDGALYDARRKLLRKEPQALTSARKTSI
ncbi:hypothetical protein BDP27DRAFT_1316240 [Rhodocollybia butyracea]|uniref:Uncharacterized protein n=1 Tax=Rhodocollybia butyracea TaxID=206335 RepID=A0A9P5UCA7_9AGAR|nr:hypothetical protein BDP27DRAFT_1316240 [Rhodocollybia butyracea]